MKTTIITFGKTKNSELSSLVSYYSKLNLKYGGINHLELRDTTSKISMEQLETSWDKSYNIVLSEHGREFTTVDFANKLNGWKMEGVNIQFVIGNAHGFEKEVLDKSDLLLSLGKMTYPHEMAHVLLLEQLFRVNNLLAGGKYHK